MLGRQRFFQVDATPFSRARLFLAALVFIPFVVVIAWSNPVGARPLSDGLSVSYKSPLAPPLILQGLDGKTYDVGQYMGRVVVVNFWASWCAPCVAEMPAIQRMWEKLRPEGVEVLAVNAGESGRRIAAFLARFETRLTFPILLEPKGEAYETWGVRGLPRTFVVAKDGRIIYEAEGGRDLDSEHIRGLLRGLLAR